jgi:hypothetical protein
VAALCAGGEPRARRALADGFARFQSSQPELSGFVTRRLSQSLDEHAATLGQLLSVAVFLAFDDTPGLRLRSVEADGVAAAEAGLATDEQLRKTDPVDALDSEDIVAIEQPALVSFVNDQVGATLERNANSIDVDDVAAVFRCVLVEILALSHAVEPPPGYPIERCEEPMA